MNEENEGHELELQQMRLRYEQREARRAVEMEERKKENERLAAAEETARKEKERVDKEQREQERIERERLEAEQEAQRKEIERRKGERLAKTKRPSTVALANFRPAGHLIRLPRESLITNG